MSYSFTNVNSFRLKYPQYSPFRKNKTDNGEWIELYKNRNQLPTAKLRTWVLYYRNDGKEITTDNPGDHTENNYAFYGNEPGVNSGEQIGWIFGFPLFNVGATQSNWPKFHSRSGNFPETNPPTFGNNTMLVDLSNSRNIITIDFDGYNIDAFSGQAKSLDYISNNISEKGFYLNLRIKNTSENELKNFRTHTGETPFGWATLVEYVYECDIIGPKSMLDLNLDYFLYLENSNSEETKLFGESLKLNNTSFKLAYLDYVDSNTYHDNLKICILTGLGPTDSTNSTTWSLIDRIMDTDQIYNYLIHSEQYINGSPIELQSPYSSTNGHRITKIIGGFYNTSKSNGYYPNLSWYGSNNPLYTMSNDTKGWSKNSRYTASNGDNGENKLDSDIRTYELNNILWCSLNSQRKKKVRVYGVGGNTNFRYIDNYLDLNGEYCNGGGYGRFPNTIDLPRKNIKPYYSNQKVNNSNMVTTFNEFQGEESEQYYQDNITRTFNDISNSKFNVYYKLLVPPIVGESFKISYNFGMTIAISKVGGIGSKVTFFRSPTMDGNAVPSAGNGENESNLWAVRNSEKLELEWTVNDIDSNGDISMKTMTLIDVASGKSIHPASVEILPTTSLLKRTQTGTVENYQITANIIQFLSVNSIDQNVELLEQNTYQRKNFNNIIAPQSFFIDLTPKNYEPYRYYNKYIPDVLSSNFLSTTSDSPLLLVNEQLNYNYRAIKPNFTTILDSNIQENLNPIIQSPLNSSILVDISGNEDGNRIEIVRNNLELENDDILILFESQEKLITSNQSNIKLNTFNNSNIDFVIPHSLDLNNNLISDYWRLYNPLIRDLASRSTSSTEETKIPYEYLTNIVNMHNIQNSNVSFTDENNKLIKYILVNSNENKENISALTIEGEISTDNLVIEVAGQEYFTVQLDEHPMIVELQVTTIEDNPFGPNRWYYIGDRNVTVRSENGGVNLPTLTNFNRFSMNSPLSKALSRYNVSMRAGDETNTLIWNNVYNINIKSLDDNENGTGGYQNSSVNGFAIAPDTFQVLLVNIPKLEYINPVNPETGEIDYTFNLNENNSLFIIEWKGFDFLLDDTFNKDVENGGTLGKKLEIVWNIKRLNTSTNITTVLFSGIESPDLSYEINGSDVKYKFIDRNVRIFDKYIYSIDGICRWSGIKDILVNDGLINDVNENIQIPSFNIEGFTTPEYFICKKNRFPYGRFNTTATNLKLYRPLLLRTSGQVDHFGRKIGGDCSSVNKSRPNVLSDGGSNNNIYINTADQMTKKETFKRLSTLRLKR